MWSSWTTIGHGQASQSFEAGSRLQFAVGPAACEVPVAELADGELRPTAGSWLTTNLMIDCVKDKVRGATCDEVVIVAVAPHLRIARRAWLREEVPPLGGQLEENET
jgi:hypothetical protein